MGLGCTAGFGRRLARRRLLSLTHAPTALAGGPSTSAAAAASSSAPAAEQELEYSEAKAAVLLWERTFESTNGRPPTERERAASPTYRERLRRYKG